MQEDQVKRSSVKLSNLPVGRKFLMIRDGKQLLMLKALGGSRSVYSIEEGIPRTGITRSGKRHFQFSLPKFVNGLEGMNEHIQKSDHVVDHSRVGPPTQPKRGHFAKKSTGNNLKHTLNHLKGSPTLKSGQQHSKQSLSSSAKKTLPNSSDDANQTGSAQRPKNHNNVQSEAVRISKTASKREDGPTEIPQMTKETKPSDTSIKHEQERKIVTERVVNQRSDSPVHPSNDSLKKEKVNLDAAKEVKKGKHNLGNKENNPKLKEAQITKEQPADEVSCKQRTEHSTSCSKEQTSTGVEQSKCNSTASTGNSTEKNVTTNTNDVHTSTPDGVPSVEKITKLSDCQKSPTRISRHIDNTSIRENHSMATDHKWQRASTPTPESPVKNNALGRLSRKRHRSASPITLTSSTDSKITSKVAKKNVKPNRESIKLDSKNFEKVKNACKNAISQRKEKTSLDKGSSEPTQMNRSGVIKRISKEGTAAKNGCGEKLSKVDTPPAKKKKVSGTMESQDGTCENNISAVASRSSDSEDGLTKLMKDFQSAMSSPSLKTTLKASATPMLKGNLRYISKKTSRCLTNGKTMKTLTGNEKVESKVTQEKTKSTVGVSSELNNLQPEDISSDEDFGSSQETHRDITSKGTYQIPSNGELSCKEKRPSNLSIQIPDTNISPSKGTFVVVDEVGFTPDESNSSHSLFHEDHKQFPDPLNKMVEQVASTKSESLPLLVSGTLDLKENASPVVTGEVEAVVTSLKQSVVKKEELAEEETKLNCSTRVEVKSTQSMFTQTDDPVEKKDVASEAKMLKPDVKDQSVQFCSITNSVDPEEITPIVTAMFESECEEKERLKKALDEKIGKEEKWRNMVKDLCRQLRDLRQQLEKKEFDKHGINVGINTASEASSALPVIISTQATQTEYCESPVSLCAVSDKPDTSQQNGEGNTKCPAERTAIQSQSKSAGLPSIENSNSHEPNKLDAVSPSPEVIMSQETTAHSVANIAINLTTTVQSPGAHTGVKNGTKVIEKSSEATEVIDLTDSEDVNLAESRSQAKMSPVQSPLKLAVNLQGLPITCQNSLPVSSKSNILQSNSKSPSKDQPQANIIGPVASQAGFPQVPSLHLFQPEKPIPAIIRTPVSSAQINQRPIQRQMQNQFQLNSVNRTSAHVVTQLVATQVMPKQTLPPPLKPAPTIAASIYNKPQTSQLPILSPSLGMLVRAQVPQRQDVVLSGVSQQMVQHHGLTPLQQQQVKNSVLIEEFKRGLLQQPGLSTYQGSASIILPSGSHQVTTIPLRLPQALPQVQSTLQASTVHLVTDRDGDVSNTFLLEPNKQRVAAVKPSSISVEPNVQLTAEQWKVVNKQCQEALLPSGIGGKKGMILDEKRDGGLQRQAYQAYQQKHLGNTPQLKSVLTEVEGSDKSQMQGFRNFKVTVPPSGITSQAHRYPPPPAYSSAPATVQQVSHINTPTVYTQSANALQQREVVNGVKQYVPLSSLSSQPRNAVQVVGGRTWFPNSRQGEIAGQLNKGNPTQQIINVDSKSPPKHPAPLPILQSSTSIVDKGSLLPSPSIRISDSPEGVVLSWNITTNQDHPTVRKYLLYAYQVLNTPPSSLHWKRIGEVGALPPPMACTLNQFQPGSTYFLAICAVDVYDRPGWFSKTEKVVIPQ